MKIYLGLRASDSTREIFRNASDPTFATHGDRFNAVIGPFRTMRGARFMRDYGQGNPHCWHVDQAERLARVVEG